MKRISTLAALFISLIAPVTAQEITLHTSPNGHKFSFYHMPNSDRVAISVAWKGGIAQLPLGKENVASMAIDLMLNGGAAGRAPDDIRAEFEAMDAGSHLYSDADAIRGFVVAPAKDLRKAAAIANGVISKPTLDERWFKRFIRNAKKNVSQNAEYNNTQAWHTVRHLTMGGHRLEQAWSWQPSGNLDDLTIDDVRTWYKQSFSTNDLVISAAGNGISEEIGLSLDKALEGLPTSHERSDLPPLGMTYSGKTILIHRPDEEKSYMTIVGPLPAAGHPDKLALMIGAGVLGQSEQSRLYKAVRGDLRAAYGFGADIYAFTREQDMLALSGEVETAKLEETLAAVEQTYAVFKSGGIGRIEFPFAKRIMLKRIRENYQKPSTIAFVMTEAFFEGKTLEQAVNMENQADKLGRSSVNKSIAKHFPEFDGMLKIIVSPDAEAVRADCVISDFKEADRCL